MMTTAEFRLALAALGWSAYAAAPYLGISRRTAQRIARGDAAVPKRTEVLLGLLLAGKIRKEDLYDPETD